MSASDFEHDAPRGADVPSKVVGIGASAGGLESLEHLFANLPPDTGMAFVVVQHLSPDFKSLMDELLSRYSALPVHVAEDGVEVRPDNVYLLPPRKEITIRDGRLRLTDKDPSQGLALPIDQFFSSLAEDQGPRSVAIVLSGTGSDGSRGVQRIKRVGGTVIVESPDSAKFNGMPMSAIATGMVDHVLESKDIAAVLTGGVPRAPDDEVDETPLEAVFRLLHDQFGLDFSLYKTSTVSRRVLRRVEMQGTRGLEDYAERLRSDPEELSSLYQDLLIGVTRFFRDPDAFGVLETKAIPEILERVPPSEEIRAWVAGCATGEEAYSVAIALYEALVAAGRPINVKVLATDVHHASLEYASAGLYGEDQLEHVSETRRKRFFVRKPGGYQISQDIRQLIVLAPHNMTKDAPFTKMHLITCRNVLIYFEPAAQKTVLSLFHFGLAQGGILFLGSSESTGALAHEFVQLDDHWKLYRKRRDVRLLEPLRMSVLRRAAPKGVHPNLARGQIHESQLLSTYDQLLDRFMPPALLVDEDRTLLDNFGGAERFLRVGRRRPSSNLLDLVDGDLRTVLAGAVQRALKLGSSVQYNGVPHAENGVVRRWTLVAEPFANPRSAATHVLITFAAEEGSSRPEVAPPASVTEASDSRITSERLRTLESELAYTRETLQAAVEELQTSNEELQATNEELVASNEELQSTNEELHSVNEELYTVNAEYQKKIQELREVNADMQHLLEGTDVGMLFLDGELRIRKFTPRIAQVFHLQAQDMGRQIRDFAHDLQRPALVDELEATLLEGRVVEEEVRDGDGTTWFLRILPYRPGQDANGPATPDPRGEGVVLALTDISALARARSRVEHLSAIVESSSEAIIGNALDGTIIAWNGGAERLFGWTADEAIGKNLRTLIVPPEHADEATRFIEMARRGERVPHTETVRVRKDGGQLDVSVTLSPIRDRDGHVVGVSSIARDITALKRAQAELAEREARLRSILDSTAEAIVGVAPDGTCTFCNTSTARLLGYGSTVDLIGRPVQEFVRHARGDESPLAVVLKSGRSFHSDDDVLIRADGSSFAAEYWSYPVRRDGRLDGAVITFMDITHRKQAELEIHTAARRREQFLAMMSHELRNPLAAVVSATRLMQQANLDSDILAIGRARDVIERQAAHMARLLDDLLDVSRITRGGIELRKADLDLRDVVLTALEAVGPLLAARTEDLRVDLPDEAVPVRGDPARLQQVVVNLLSNAARYSPGGTPIHLVLSTSLDRVTITVDDQGCGIEPEMLSSIFDLFVQANQGLDRSRGGLGVGLTLVKTIVELHGGAVEARSAGPNRGSTFVATIPLDRRAAVARRALHDAGAQLPPRRVVLVEDQPDARSMLGTLLRKRGHVVFEAADGPSAVETIERERPDVALVDIGLPVMSGYDVARRVRSDPRSADVLLVALTGYGTSDDVKAAYQAGFDAHLTKPTDPDDIERILDRRRDSTARAK